MARIAVITDSACDLEHKDLAALGVTAVPLTVTFGDKVYADGVDLTREEFYRILATSKEPARTAQPAPSAYAEAYTRALQGSDLVVTICLSAGLSGTYESALIAREQMPDPRRITVFDSRAASIGQALMVMGAAERAASGQSLEEMLGYLEGFRAGLTSIFTLDTLEYLVRGGRLSRAEGMVGSLLKIKPLLQLDGEGKIVPREKARGRRQAVERLLEIIAEEGHELAGQRIGICHARAVDEALDLAGQIRARYKVGEVVVGEISAVIGSHVGPGCLAVFFQK